MKNLNPYYFLNILVKPYGVQALKKGYRLKHNLLYKLNRNKTEIGVVHKITYKHSENALESVARPTSTYLFYTAVTIL